MCYRYVCLLRTWYIQSVSETNTIGPLFSCLSKTKPRAPPAEMRGGGVEGGRGSHDVQEHTAREGEGACAPSQKFGSMMMAVGRVRFDHLVVNKDEELLGEGTFGMVMPGTYYGQDVAVKKARDFRGSARVKELFRCGREQRISCIVWSLFAYRIYCSWGRRRGPR